VIEIDICKDYLAPLIGLGLEFTKQELAALKIEDDYEIPDSNIKQVFTGLLGNELTIGDGIENIRLEVQGCCTAV